MNFSAPRSAPKPGLGHHVVGQLHRGLGGDHGAAAVGDVGERATVHERGRVLEGLDEVGGQGVLQQDGHGPVGIEVSSADGLLRPVVPDHDAAEPVLEIGQRGGQAEDRHDLRRHDDVESVLAREAVAGASECDRDVAEGAVVHVHDALPRDPTDIDVQRVAVVDVVVDERGQQVVGQPDRTEVAGEVQVDVLHRDDLGVATTGRAALHAEDRPEGGLAQADDGPLADHLQSVRQSDARGRLALARRGRADGRDQDELRVGVVGKRPRGSPARSWPCSGRRARPRRRGCRAGRRSR